jgi:NitT/TauT family transport system substrate-binding protein
MGGHADLAVCGLQNVVNVAARGGNVVAIARVFDVVLNALVLSNASMEKAGIKADMSADEKVKRLRGLQIGISSPGVSTDKVLRSFFASRGLDPDKEIAIKPLGAAENILTGLQQGVIDGFVYAAPVPDIAGTRVPSTIVLDPLRSDVPEFQDAPFAALCTSRDTLEKKRPQLNAVVRAFTKAMKFAAEHPAEASQITRQRFKQLDEAVFKAAFDFSLKGVPTHPLLTQRQFDRLLEWVNLTEKTPVKASYLDAVYPDLAREAGREILGK